MLLKGNADMDKGVEHQKILFCFNRRLPHSATFTTIHRIKVLQELFPRRSRPEHQSASFYHPQVHSAHVATDTEALSWPECVLFWQQCQRFASHNKAQRLETLNAGGRKLGHVPVDRCIGDGLCQVLEEDVAHDDEGRARVHDTIHRLPAPQIRVATHDAVEIKPPQNMLAGAEVVGSVHVMLPLEPGTIIAAKNHFAIANSALSIRHPLKVTHQRRS